MDDKLIASGALAPELLEKIERAAVSAAREILTGRKILDVEGPYGLGLTSLEVGNDDICREPGPTEASAVLSQALSVPMIYRRFSLSKRRIAASQESGQPLNLKSGGGRGPGGGCARGGICLSRPDEFPLARVVNGGRAEYRRGRQLE